MASSSAYLANKQAQAQNNVLPRQPQCLPMQKKILENVLECIVQLKSEFFERHEPFTDDCIVLQRFCAKFEHFLQIGMKEKVSLLGRKKDYWDYFCDCLGSSKGINDGIKYVKSLNENKTSLGRGRAFIRFCLVHQRLADMLQQCVVHDKTADWFIPGTLMWNKDETNRLITQLYDLNSMHFDLSPRGYDLDNSWPAFANRKLTGTGSWNVPISRRSSMTSMDAISAISVSLDSTAEVDRLAKNLEAAQSTTNDLVGQIGALQQEKVEVSQSVWATQGELQACQQQLKDHQEQHSLLQSRHQELDVNHVKLKLEMEHIEKIHKDEVQRLQSKLDEESSRRVTQLAAEEEIWKKERVEESGRMQRDMDRLTEEMERAKTKADEERESAAELYKILGEMLAQAQIKVENEDFLTATLDLSHTLTTMQQKLIDLDTKKSSLQEALVKEEKDKQKQISLLEGRLLEQERALQKSQDSEAGAQTKMVTLELELKDQKERSLRAYEEKSLLEGRLHDMDAEVKDSGVECASLRSKVAELELRYESVVTERDYLKSGTEKTDALSSEIRTQLEATKAELTKVRQRGEETERDLREKCDDFSSQVENQKEELVKLEKYVEEKEKEVNLCKVNADKEMSDLRRSLEEKIKQSEELEHEVKESARQLEILSKETGEVGEGNLVLREQLELAEGEIERLKGCLEDVEEKVTDLGAEVEKRIEDGREKDAQVKELEDQCSLLRSTVEEKGQLEESLRSNVTKMGQELKVSNQKGADVEALRTELSCVRQEREEMKREMDTEKERMLGVLSESEGAKRSESEKEEKISSLILETEKLRREKDAGVSQLEDRARVLNTQVNQRDAEITKLSSQVEALQSELEYGKEKFAKLSDTEAALTNLQAKLSDSEVKFRLMINTMEAEASEQRHSHENEVSSFTERIKHLESQFAESRKSHDQACVDYEKTIQELKTDKDSLVSSSSEDSEKLTELTKTISSLTEDNKFLKGRLDNTETELRKEQEQLSEVAEQLVNVKVNLEKSEQEKATLKSELETMGEELTKIEDSRDHLQISVSEVKDQLRAAEDQVQEKLVEKREMELQLGEVESKLELAETKLAEVMSKLSEAELVQQSVQSSQFSAQVLEDSLMEARKTLEELRAERSSLQDKFDKLTSENGELQRQVRELQAAHKELEDSMPVTDESELENVSRLLEEEKRRSKLAVETLNEEISALQFQLSAEQMQQGLPQDDNVVSREIEEKVKCELRERVSDQEIIIERLEQELQSAQAVKRSDTSQVTKLEKKIMHAQENLRAGEKRVAQTSERLEQECNARQKLEAELESVRKTFSKTLEDKAAVIKNLESDNIQYRKKLVKLIRDKDNLWHQTDKLVNAQKRKSEERWQDNADVTHCLTCKAEFSLFVRKHHCRLCGRIFCWSCSDFWLDSTLSSKKVRCCKLCFDHNNETESAQLSSSMINHASDDDDDDEEEEAEGTGSEVASLSSNLSNRLAAVADDQSSGIGASERLVPQQTSSTSVDYSAELGQAHNNKDGDGDVNDDEGDGNIYDAYNNDNDDERQRSKDDEDDADFQVVSQEELEREMTHYRDTQTHSASFPSNMTSSIVLSAEELESGKVNQQNEVWVKPGKTFIVPVDIEEKNTLLHWSFTSQPKDIVFSVTYRANESTEIADAEEIVAPCKCDSHKQTVTGDLTAKEAGIYSLVFDNTYSRLTSKKVHYWLEYKKTSS